MGGGGNLVLSQLFDKWKIKGKKYYDSNFLKIVYFFILKMLLFCDNKESMMINMWNENIEFSKKWILK